VASLPAIRAAFRMAPERAASYLRDKGLQITGPYWELDGPQHSRVFTVANLAKVDVLADIKRAVQQAIDDGTTERWFRRELEGVLRRKGWWGPAVEVDPATQEARIVQQGSYHRLPPARQRRHRARHRRPADGPGHGAGRRHPGAGGGRARP